MGRDGARDDLLAVARPARFRWFRLHQNLRRLDDAGKIDWSRAAVDTSFAQAWGGSLRGRVRDWAGWGHTTCWWMNGSRYGMIGANTRTGRHVPWSRPPAAPAARPEVLYAISTTR